MKVLVVVPYFASKPGGVEKYVAFLVEGLRADGRHEVVVVTLHRGKSPRLEVRRDGLRIHYLPYRWKVSNTALNTGWPEELRRILDDEAPDVVNVHMPVPGLADIATRVCTDVPVVLTYHNDVVKPGWMSGVALAYHLLVGRKTLARATRIVTTSPRYVQQSRRLRRHSHKIGFAPPGVDRSLFNLAVDSTEVRQRFPGERFVLFVGNLDSTHAHKGLANLLRAFALVDRTDGLRLVIIGNGTGLPGYVALAEETGLGSTVTFVGVVSEIDLAAYYAAAEVVVLPSTSAAEGFGMVLAEAQACGTPVIGSNVGGIPATFVEGQSGMSVRPGSVTDLADRITDIIAEPNVRRRLADGAARHSQRFDWARTVSAMEAVLEQVRVAPVVHISTYFPPAIGGLERVAEQCAGSAVRSGVPAGALTSNGGSSMAPGVEWTASGVHVQRLRAVCVANLPILPALLIRVLALRGRPILHVHYSQAGLVEIVLTAAWVRRLPVVVHYHLDVRASGRFGAVFEWYRHNILPVALRHAEIVAVFSAEQKQDMVEQHHLDPKTVRVVPNGVTISDPAPCITAPASLPKVLFVGRLAPQKQVDTLLKALVGISELFETRIVGDGELRSTLERSAATYGLANVTFVGTLSSEQVRQEMRAADVFVLPSAREGMPLVLLEAMAEGPVVMGSNVTGIRDLVTHGHNGLLFDDGDSDSLRALLLELRAGSCRASHLQSSAYETALGYGWEKTGHALLEIYKELSLTASAPR